MVDTSLLAINMPPWYVSLCLHLLSAWWWSNLSWDICKAIIVCSTTQGALYICLAVPLALFTRLIVGNRMACQSPCSFIVSFPTLSAKKQQAKVQWWRFAKRQSGRRKGQAGNGTERRFPLISALILLTVMMIFCSCISHTDFTWQLLPLGRKIPK